LATPSEVAAYLQVPVKTLYTLALPRKGPRAHSFGRYLRYRWEDVEAWLASGRPLDEGLMREGPAMRGDERGNAADGRRARQARPDELANGDDRVADRPIQAGRAGAHRGTGFAASDPPRLPDAAYEEIADVLMAEAERIASSGSS